MRAPKPDATKTYARLVPFGILALVVFLLSGCTAIGPPTIERDRFDYVSAISASWKRQTLLNLLKTRYQDAPVFLDVASVINQYSMEHELNLGIGGEFYNRSEPSFVDPRVGAIGRYADRPTITYNPLMGKDFARSLMRPIPLPPVLTLLQSGYPADVVLRICTQSIQGLQNCRSTMIAGREADPEFYELIDSLRKLQDMDAIAIRSQSTGNEMSRSIIFRQPENDGPSDHLKQVMQLLNLDAGTRKFPVVPGNVAVDNREIAILSRSMMQIMTEYAACIEVPASDIAEGRVHAVNNMVSDSDHRLPPLIRVHNSAAEPGMPYVAVPYRGSWFWIDDRDIHSKSMFYFLMVLSSFTERGDSEQAAPIISVPTN